MTSKRFSSITSQYSKLRIAVGGDFCLDRYLEIDPWKKETSIETGLPVRNVINVRAQAGAAGTVDIVGAGDAVTANAAAALAAGATLREAIELAVVGSSIVIHQLGTTGTASVAQLRELLYARKHGRGVPSLCT
jgi:bifunctional ADP-heptose synthase (sugar kinase/adenylyltransferase)